MARKLVKTSSTNIPPEIIEIILSKLSSVKSLLRFKSVSKSWNTIISDPLFIQNHLHSSNKSPNNDLFLRRYTNSTDRGFPLVKLEGGKVHAGGISVENIPNGYNVILCECNGLLLLTDRCSEKKYALWNPSTRRARHLATRYELNGDYVVDHGICYDKITGDFKVVFIFATKYAIYSCNNYSWTKKDLGTKCRNIGFTGSGIFVDGATYWILGVESTNISGTLLVYFDSRTDKLKVLRMPEQLYDDKIYFLSCNMASLRGSLCLYSYNYRDNSVHIWIKEKGIDFGDNRTNWKEFVTVGYLRLRYLWMTPLCFVENKVVIQEKSIRFVSTEKTVEEFLAVDVYRGRFIPYRDSLYFPAGVKTIRA
ncbi:hypothetical protein MIMGU_mgv1a018082mg [Erythranthe guttata]|uniref:F-box domain-containing protein n=1 Tax=Erythranthe guttata TaxID=4155 RepID=A0A022QUH0_ERYGU|nr:PREDICTED: probable F-box protein At5g47300 [Erythranthe guttata]EYU31541.1 hypothetical protein MIMGU_mgv1a018082mg [Erythranthe guttata]|eukprot:XP_012844474.1 PREDICTED: probable F-box protein At5g47300 [Erythranthe guttata]